MDSFVRKLVLVLSASVLVLERIVMAEPTFDHERLDVYRLSIAYMAYSYQIAKSSAVRIDKLETNGCVRRNRFH